MNHSHPVRPRASARSGAFKLFGAFAAASLLFGCGEDPQPQPSRQVRVQVLGINDFHGNLEAPTGSNGQIRVSATSTVNAGGATYLAHHIDKLRQENPNTVVVSAGDLIGASPLVSGVFHDEPTIEVMNLIGLDINGVGNHEFDDGTTELLRMQNGGSHPIDGNQDGTPFDGAKFKFLSANVFTNVATKETLLPPYDIREFEGVKIAFIGMTLEGTRAIVNPAGIQNVTFADEADTVNALIPELKGEGVEAIVVVLHEGGLPTGLYNECPGISGPIVDIVERFDDAVDVVVSGHTHQAYNCVVDGKLVTSAAAFGRLVTDIDLVLDTTTKDVVEASANNVIVTRDTANTPVDQFVRDVVARAAPQKNKIIGSTPVELKAPVRPPAAGTTGESTMGNVVADAMLWATREESKGGAVIAMQNSGGVRADINVGEITFGEVFTVQPFANNLVTITMTGADIHDVLEQQWDNPSNTVRILQVSQGFAYTFKNSGPKGDKIDPSTITLNGTVIDPAASYRVTVNNFMAAGGDDYLAFAKATAPLTGPIDLDALEAYLRATNPLPAPSLGRITRVE